MKNRIMYIWVKNQIDFVLFKKKISLSRKSFVLRGNSNLFLVVVTIQAWYLFWPLIKQGSYGHLDLDKGRKNTAMALPPEVHESLKTMHTSLAFLKPPISYIVHLTIFSTHPIILFRRKARKYYILKLIFCKNNHCHQEMQENRGL